MGAVIERAGQRSGSHQGRFPNDRNRMGANTAGSPCRRAAVPFLTRAEDVIVMTVEVEDGSGDVDRLVRNANPDLHDAGV